MKWKQGTISGVLAIVATLSLVGCSSKKQAQVPNHEVRIMSKDLISTMDSSLMTDILSAQSAQNTMDGLYRYSGRKIEPAVATRVVSPTNNGLTYTFPLRKNAKWSNGDPVVANDFVYAWKRTVNPKTKSQYAYIYEGIANAKSITAGKKPVNSLGVKALNAHTLQVTLEKPIPYFNQLMTGSQFYPQNPRTVKKWGKKYGTSSKALVFNGPYKLVNWSNSDNTWKEVKNDQYWDAKNVKVHALKYQVVKDASTALNLYQSNKLDRAELTGDTSKQMKGSKGYSVQKQNSTYYLEMNQKRLPMFKNQKLRQALSYAIDRQQLAKKVLGNGTSAATSATAADMSYDPNNKNKDFVGETSQTGKEYTQFNLKKAKALWKQGLAETGQTGKKMNLTLLSDDADIDKQRSEFLQSSLQKLPGLKITLNNVPYKSRISRSQSGDFDLVATAWNADFPDPINFLTLFMSDNSYNNGKWSNSQYDDLVNKSMNEDANNPTARWNDMKAAQNILNEQQGVVPLYQNGQAFMTKARVKNMDYTPSNMYNMVSVRLKK
ncbi:peptide ABC transporter substrate-binding protein [Bombilactobacillus folatiphilus]|uniref:Peptide ABC transporter substrate-binding protein n=1 Tax=Bombilactobacillus folatiphilus TaxID=2923362 RepID=A0ABY4P8X9_9LACO|nr:peptide ABC transporter substrate-binding protein [Bombilactobacillus folatiphilus]UQS82034.1 peptide ABC transporter substrate-binding protein [Bombilactobacillus folatiphilus]